MNRPAPFLLRLALGAALATAQADVVLENAHLRYTISEEGKNLSFVDRATAIDYLGAGAGPCAVVRRGGTWFP